MKKTEKLKVAFRGQTVGSLSFTSDKALHVFEYESSWLEAGFSISPIELPLKSARFVGKPSPFDGGFGIFEDSLPDGYGRLLLHKELSQKGVNDSDLSSLDRLAIVGDQAMGALSYSPAAPLKLVKTETDFDRLQQIALEVLSERNEQDAGLLLFKSGNSGGARPKAVFSDEKGNWLIKFCHTYDPTDIGLTEYRCNEAARRCGIAVPDFRLMNERYFAVRRFDIDEKGNRVHTATAGGLLGLSLQQPFLDYSNLLALTGFITQSREDVEQMFRRMVFNYLIGNKDDHCKNFTFYVVKDSVSDKWRWRLVPAYDLTPCSGAYNGEHATSVNGTGKPRLTDFIAVGTKIKLSESRCREIFEEVREGCSDLIEYSIQN